MTIQEYIDAYMDPDDSVLLVDRYESAFLGVLDGFAVYDRAICIEILKNDGMTEEDAEKHFAYNVEGGYIEGGPRFLRVRDV